MKSVLLAVVAAFAIFAAACGDDGEAPAPGQTASPTSGVPVSTPPPGASLSVGGASIDGGIGTHCWSGFCRDYTGPITSPLLSQVAPGEAFTLSFQQGTPTEVVISWYKAPAPPPPAHGVLAWSLDPRTATRAERAEAPAEPGLYVLSVFARWDGKGDVTYGWYIEVR
jgi:hypothetical protein